MSEYPDCYESSNLLCKHVRASITAYFDMNDILPPGVTVVSGTVDTDAEDLVVGSPATVVEEDTVVEQTSQCAGVTLYADRALSFTVADGAVSDDEVLVTVCWIQSDGDEDCRDLRLLVGGRVASP